MHVLIVSGRLDLRAQLNRAVTEQLSPTALTMAMNVATARQLLPIIATAAGLVAIVDVHTPRNNLTTEETCPSVTVAELMAELTRADAWIATVHEQQGDLAALGDFRGSTHHDTRDADEIVATLVQNRRHWDPLSIPTFEDDDPSNKGF